VTLFVCLSAVPECVRAVKVKQLELSTPNLVDMIADGRCSACVDSEVNRSRSQRYQGSAGRYDCLGFLVTLSGRTVEGNEYTL